MVSNDSAAPGGPPGITPWAVSRRVIGALVLREMLTRYGRNNIGFLWLFVEPLLFTLVVISVKAARIGVYGSDISGVAFAITGWPALMLWRNMPNRCTGAVKSNRTLLHHRQVTIPDLFIARIIVEFMAASTSFVFLTAGFYVVGELAAPEDILKVIAAWFLLAWFGAGLAFTIASLSDRFVIVDNLWRPMSYVLMPLSGIAFLIQSLPPGYQEIVMWVPMLNCVELLRDGWFGSLFVAHYDIGYVVVFNLCLSFVGIALLRQVGLTPSEE
jgi:ABC-2 type transport system permease protein/capsular polysaccharide transport system permease protein